MLALPLKMLNGWLFGISVNRIKLELFSSNPRILEVANSFAHYIKEQVLADDLKTFAHKISSKFTFENKLDDGDLVVGIDVSS